jgi:hypothetical protein
MSQIVRARYQVEVLCVDAVGVMKNRCIKATASGILTVLATDAVFVVGTGSLVAQLELTALRDPDGADILNKVPADKRKTESSTYMIKDQVLTLDTSIMDGAVDLAISVRLGTKGETLDDGKVTCTINKWLWKLMLKSATATFTGTCKEFMGA